MITLCRFLRQLVESFLPHKLGMRTRKAETGRSHLLETILIWSLSTTSRTTLALDLSLKWNGIGLPGEMEDLVHLDGFARCWHFWVSGQQWIRPRAALNDGFVSSTFKCFSSKSCRNNLRRGHDFNSMSTLHAVSSGNVYLVMLEMKALLMILKFTPKFGCLRSKEGRYFYVK
jgi:hypothetical protein